MTRPIAASVAAAVLLCSSAVIAQAQQLAWDLPSGGASPTGFVVIIDGVRSDKGLTPLGTNGTCGCATPLGLSGGNHTIIVGAYNASGESDSAPLTVGPTANAGGPYSGVAGTSITVDGSKSNAPTGSLTTYAWNWGDGSAVTSLAVSAATHVYSSAGTYTIKLTVTDNAGATATATTTATVTAAPPPGGPGPLPSPWASQDIGAVGLAGASTYSSPTFSIAGAGSDIWGSTDAFRFAYQPLAGDGTIVARVTTEVNTDTYAKAGIMFRDSLSAGGADVILDIRPNGWIEFMSRASANGATTYLGGTQGAFPVWLKLAKSGGSITAAVSTDGTTWSTIGSTAIGLPATSYVGLAVTSHTTAALNTATFDSVAVTTAPPPSGLTGADIGAVGIAGGTTSNAGVYTVAGSGADIWGTTDAFQFAYTTLSGDSGIVARVTSMQNTNTYAKAGVMFRESLAANAANVILDERPDGSIEFMVRSTTGAATNYLSGYTENLPAWLKLQRSGSTITGYVSADGTTWAQVGSTTLTLPTVAYAGLVVTSHDTSQLNTSTFDHVTAATGILASVQPILSPKAAAVLARLFTPREDPFAVRLVSSR